MIAYLFLSNCYILFPNIKDCKTGDKDTIHITQ